MLVLLFLSFPLFFFFLRSLLSLFLSSLLPSFLGNKEKRLFQQSGYVTQAPRFRPFFLPFVSGLAFLLTFLLFCLIPVIPVFILLFTSCYLLLNALYFFYFLLFLFCAFLPLFNFSDRVISFFFNIFIFCLHNYLPTFLTPRLHFNLPCFITYILFFFHPLILRHPT